jgi:hypothetical protein
MRIREQSGMRRATIALALAGMGALPGCISYATHIKDRTGSREGAIMAALAVVEIGAGVLGGYLVEGGPGLGDEPATLGEGIIMMTAGILMVDAFVALGIWAVED